MKTLERLRKADTTNRFFTKKGELKKEVKKMIYTCGLGPANKFRIAINQGSGRWSSIRIDNTIKNLLDTLGFSYIESNDAPRGGQWGECLVVRKATKAKIMELAN